MRTSAIAILLGLMACTDANEPTSAGPTASGPTAVAAEPSPSAPAPQPSASAAPGEIHGAGFHARIPGLAAFEEKKLPNAPPKVHLYTATSTLAPAYVYDLSALAFRFTDPERQFGEMAKAMVQQADLRGGDCVLQQPPTSAAPLNDLQVYRWSLHCPARNTESQVTGLVGRQHTFVVARSAVVGSPSDGGLDAQIVASLTEDR